MTTHRNIFACLVHERPECVVDLVDNLRYLDPDSVVLLYNGGADATLLRAIGVRTDGVIVHPRPRRMKWGRLHDFALDCMRFALDHLPFDTLTIVDSDQLALRPGYSAALGGFLAQHPGVGMLGSAPHPQPQTTRVGPALAALREIDLWRIWLHGFPNGECAFVHWTFWPSTVFTAAASRDLVERFDHDPQLQAIMRRTRIWATEEVILPTLTVLLGYRIAPNLSRYDYVQYRVAYSLDQLKAAFADPCSFWMHPVPRELNHSLRRLIRDRFNNYDHTGVIRRETMASHPPVPPLVLTLPILQQMRSIEGWLEDDEADLLIALASHALISLSTVQAIVEVGSYCGRSTIVLGSVIRTLDHSARVYAVDPHEGQVGASGQNLHQGAPTLERFRRNIAAAGLTEQIVTIQQRSYEVAWNQPISLLLIDGLHDYASVARDVAHFMPWVVATGYIAFHDYADYYPGVKLFVDELLRQDDYRYVARVRSMIVVQKLTPVTDAQNHRATLRTISPAREGSADLVEVTAAAIPARPVVSCIMPTHNRRAFVPQALAYFARQDYPDRELIIVDDGSDPVSDLMLNDARIRYLRPDRPCSIGTKRNLACQSARGTLIVHWDDDDWIANWRLSYQVDQLLTSGADVCGLDTLLFYRPATDQAWRYTYPHSNKTWVAGGTLCYTRSFWRTNPFPDINVGEDTRFVWGNTASKIIALTRSDFYVALIHAQNTAAKHTSSRRWQAVPGDQIHSLIGPDITFYRPRLP